MESHEEKKQVKNFLNRKTLDIFKKGNKFSAFIFSEFQDTHSGPDLKGFFALFCYSTGDSVFRSFPQENSNPSASPQANPNFLSFSGC